MSVMRTLCLLLILANALYFVWANLMRVETHVLDRAPARTATPVPRIALAEEVTPPPLPEDIREVQPPRVTPVEERPAAPRGEPVSDASCISIGPFADLPQAAQAQAALRGAEYEPEQRVDEGELWVGYWVSVQDFATRADAEAALETLKANGISDVYLMPGTDPNHILSLGVFSDQQRAQRRADQVRALGFAPRIDDRTRTGAVYWLDVPLSEPGQTIDMSLFQSDASKIMRLEMKSCPE